MTIIAFDGKSLVADRAATSCGFRRSVKKIHKVPNGAVGFAGSGVHAQMLLAWFEAGRPMGAYPKPPEGQDCADAIFITPNGLVYHYGGSEHPVHTFETFDAIGSGRDYALAAMYLGYDAVMAVEIACHFDNGCGNGHDVITLEELQRDAGWPQ